MTHLLLTVRLLDDRYHGLLDRGGPPEWPPSPFRLFCALVAGLARRGELEGDPAKALACLQTLDPPTIIAPEAKKGQAITRYVPNNDGDKRPDRQDRLGTKPTIPTLFLLAPNRKPEVHYVWHIGETSDVPFEHIRTAARSLTALGWGIDMAFADARLVPVEEIRRLAGTRWRPTRSENNGDGIWLRVPTADAELQECTLTDLQHCYEVALRRIGSEDKEPLHTLDEPRVFERVYYMTQPEVSSRPLAAFAIHRTVDDQAARPGRSRFRPFHHVRRVADVAGMARHAAADVAQSLGYASPWVDQHVLGHGPGKRGQAITDERLMFLPLPSITPVGVSGVRRVLIVGWPGCAEWPHLRRRLHASELVDQNRRQPVAMLSYLPESDSQVSRFVAPSRVWSTVTPVVLPGYDDPARLRRKLRSAAPRPPEERRRLRQRLEDRTVELLRKAFEQAGWSADAMADVDIQFRKVGWLPGLDLADNYRMPPLDYPKYHVRLVFPRPVAGPLVVGAGRYRGLGLFVADD